MLADTRNANYKPKTLEIFKSMLIIRLQRVGKKNQPFFRIVLTEKTAPPKGKYIEKLGYLDPRTKKGDLNVERINYWLSKGAQPSDTVWNLFVKKRVVKEQKRKIKIKQKKKKEGGETKKTEKIGQKPEGETKE